MSGNRRLFVGNIAASVDEYTLLQLFAKHGKITRLDFLFHKTGPLKGKPKGFAFVELATKEEALQAMTELNDKLVRGQRITVSLSNSNAPEPTVYTRSSTGKRRPMSEAAKPTKLSLMKTRSKNESTNAKIRALEAKLATMKPSEETPDGAASSSSIAVASSSTLPPKPTFEVREVREM